MALYTFTYGTMPTPMQWDAVWAINCPRDSYEITHGTPTSDADPARPPAGQYSSNELYNLVRQLIETFDVASDPHVSESAGNWASSILETLGIEWI